MYDDLRYFFNHNLWRLAIGLGLVAAAAIALGQWQPPAPVAIQPTGAALTATPLPTRIVRTTPNGAGLIPTITPTPQPPTATPTPIPVRHVVEPGEVPLVIAGAYNISVDKLLDFNNITDPTRLQIGQELIIPVTVTPSPTAPTPTPSPTLTPTPTPEPIFHIVESGDTLLEIAGAYDTSVDMLLIANELSDPRSLQVGQELIIPANTVTFGTPTVVHVIEAGDTLSYLSFYYGSTVDDILAANPGMRPRALGIGEQVIIPVTSPPVNPNANPTLPQITQAQPMEGGLASLQQQMLNAINSQRQNNGLPAYTPDSELIELALAHGQDMVARGYFAHTTPEGVTLNDRFAQHDIEAAWTGENIQRNIKPVDKTVNEAIRWFMSSRPHRANILHRRFNQVGVGVVEGPAEWYTFVLVFAER